MKIESATKNIFDPIMSFLIGPIFNYHNDKLRSWQIEISLFDKKNKPVRINSIDMPIPDGYTAQYSTVSGIVDMKMTTSAPTIISSGKNLGKKNATNALTQAYNDCMSKYRTKIKAGYSDSKPDTKISASKNQIPFPMALKTWKDFGHRLNYPLYLQPKLDGLRMIALLDKNKKVILKSRRLHDIAGFDKLRAELQTLYDNSNDKTIILDGELYKHGMDLQTISGIVRSDARVSEEEELRFMLFDCFSIGDTSAFDDRLARLESFIADRQSTSQLELNDTVSVASEIEADKYYIEKTDQGYEGIIYKSADRLYEYSLTKEKRSSWYLKRKQQFDDEFEIVGFGEGKGKDLGCVVFILKTKSGIEFNSVINGTYEYRKQLYQECVKNFDTFKGRMAKVQYEDLSSDGVPLRNRMIMIRDMSFD